MPDYSSNQPHVPIYASDVGLGLRHSRYMHIPRSPGHIVAANNAAVIPALYTAGQGQIDGLTIPAAFGNNYIEMFQTTAQAIPPNCLTTPEKGILIGGDAVDNECLELVPGGNSAANLLGQTVGTDPGVFIRATLEIADTSVYDQLVVGFRKMESYQVPTSFLTTGDALYTDFAGIGFSGTAAANLIKTMTDVGNSGSTTVFSTTFAWTDAEIHTLEVRVKGGVVRYFINGASVGSTISKNALGTAFTPARTTLTPPAYTFTAALFIIPFIFVRQGATAASNLFLRELTCGRLVEDGLQNENRQP